jgi:hypothetical protein
VKEAVVARPLVPALGATDPGVGKDRDDIPAVALGNGFKLLLSADLRCEF